jgi:hypothetical protein
MRPAFVRLRKEVAGQGLDAGPQTIAWHLEHHHQLKVSAATVSRYLTRTGLVTPSPAKRPKSSYIRFEADMPNERWQSDFTHYPLQADSTQPCDQQLDEFMFRSKAARTEFRRYIARNVPEAAQLEFTLDETAGPRATRTVLSLRPSTAEDEAPGLTPVMAQLRPADLETLDALITAGIVANRAEGIRWALARIRERPAYGQLRERAREIERLKTEF